MPVSRINGNVTWCLVVNVYRAIPHLVPRLSTTSSWLCSLDDRSLSELCHWRSPAPPWGTGHRAQLLCFVVVGRRTMPERIAEHFPQYIPGSAGPWKCFLEKRVSWLHKFGESYKLHSPIADAQCILVELRHCRYLQEGNLFHRCYPPPIFFSIPIVWRTLVSWHILCKTVWPNLLINR